MISNCDAIIQDCEELCDRKMRKKGKGYLFWTTSPSSPEVGAVAAYVDKGQADIGYQIVANKSESDLPKQWSVKLWINNVGNQSEKQEQGGYQQSCWVEDKCKIFPFLGIFFQMTISKGNFQINLGISC